MPGRGGGGEETSQKSAPPPGTSPQPGVAAGGQETPGPGRRSEGAELQSVRPPLLPFIPGDDRARGLSSSHAGPLDSPTTEP